MLTTTLSWWREGVFYQIYPRSFADSNGDGNGDLPGILTHLDHLNDGTPNSLGVDAIWLSPIYPSPMDDMGYDVSDYCDIHPMFGSLAEFDLLLHLPTSAASACSWTWSSITPRISTPGFRSRAAHEKVPSGIGTSGEILHRAGDRRTIGNPSSAGALGNGMKPPNNITITCS